MGRRTYTQGQLRFYPFAVEVALPVLGRSPMHWTRTSGEARRYFTNAEGKQRFVVVLLLSRAHTVDARKHNNAPRWDCSAIIITRWSVDPVTPCVRMRCLHSVESDNGGDHTDALRTPRVSLVTQVCEPDLFRDPTFALVLQRMSSSSPGRWLHTHPRMCHSPRERTAPFGSEVVEPVRHPASQPIPAVARGRRASMHMEVLLADAVTAITSPLHHLLRAF